MIVVGEVGLAHCGCLGTAIAYVKAIAAAGADAVKFQDHSDDLCDRFRPGTESMFVQDATRAAYWARTGFFQYEFRMIRQACTDEGVEYIVSPFSMEAFKQQAELDPDRWKIASSKVNDCELIDACVKTGKPVIVSSGMSEWPEVEAAVERVPSEQLTILECASLYPCPPEHVGIGRIRYRRHSGNIGLSDHSGTIFPSIVAAWECYDMTEVHVVFSRECFGPDVSSSITTAELRQLVQGVRFVERMINSDGFDASEIKEMREVFGVA
jgi:N,N'-diacetyllegionaminate synthase